jgi:hypothetical protein
MEAGTKEQITVTARLENYFDVYGHAESKLSADPIFAVEVTDARIDSRVMGLQAPLSVIALLGLRPMGKREFRTAGGVIKKDAFYAVRLTVQGRDCICDVTAVDDGLPVIIGQTALLAMDWVVDLKNQRLIGNPEHGGVEMAECYGDY